MPSSHWLQINEIVSAIIATNPKSLLDIGAGFGKYGVLAREYLELWDGRNQYKNWKRRIDGIEIFDSYVNPLYKIYNNVFIGNAIDILKKNSTGYDLILLIDVLEHFTQGEGKELLQLCKIRGRNVLIATPHVPSSQKSAFGNEHETHKSKWRAEDIETYGNKFIIENSKSLICFVGESASIVYNKIRKHEFRMSKRD